MADAESKGTRNPNGASTVYYSEYDGCWHGRVTVGLKDNGLPDRRHVKRKATSEDDKKAFNAVTAAVRKLEQDRDTGNVRKAGRTMSVEEWLVHWLEDIARPSLKRRAYAAYRTAVHHHLIPALGNHKMDHQRLKPEHFERLYAAILKAGGKPGTAHQVHRTARTAFGEAHRREIIVKNPVALAKAPRLDDEEIEPFEVEEIQRLIKTALGRRNGARFVLALALGTRQGESIGLKWSRLDDKTKTLKITRQLQRHTWEHGCDDPHTCGAKYHKVKPCRESCKRHQRKPCPPPCPANCTSHARWCPEKHGGGLVEVDVKVTVPANAGSCSQTSCTHCWSSTERHRPGNVNWRPTCGPTMTGCSRNRTAVRSTLAGTWTNGRPYSLKRASGTPDYTTPDTPPRRCSCSWKYPNGP